MQVFHMVSLSRSTLDWINSSEYQSVQKKGNGMLQNTDDQNTYRRIQIICTLVHLSFSNLKIIFYLKEVSKPQFK